MNFCLVDDHLLITQFIKDLLDRAYPDNTTRTYLTAESLLADRFEQWIPDMVISDILLPGMNGLDMAIALKERIPSTKLILLTSLMDLPMVKLVSKKGVDGYLTKDCTPDELMDAIKIVQAGGKYVNSALKDKLIQQIFTDDPVELHLSTREREVLQKVCAGRTPKEIAHEMELNLNTIQQYIKVIMRKFKIKRTTELVTFAIQRGLYNPNLS